MYNYLYCLHISPDLQEICEYNDITETCEGTLHIRPNLKGVMECVLVDYYIDTILNVIGQWKIEEEHSIYEIYMIAFLKH